MKYVGISTTAKIFLLSNYGSFFQHYSLRKVLKKYGVMPFRIRPRDERSSPWTEFCDNLKDIIRPFYWRLMRRSESEKLIAKLRKRKKLEKSFRKDYRNLIGRINEPMYFGIETAGIRGGDQILCRASKREWLEDIQSSNPKITYAASTDWCNFRLCSETRAYLSEKLRMFSSLGIREGCGVHLISTIVGSGISVERVLDPVLLLSVDEFKSIAHKGPVFKNPTLFCYLVNIEKDEDLQLAKYKALALELKCELKILGIQGCEEYIPESNRVILSPTEFLAAIEECDYYVTNSFHGSVFGIMYRKNFLSVLQRPVMGRDQNERQKEIMENFNLAGKRVDASMPLNCLKKAIRMEVDWEQIDAQISMLKEKSLKWLIKSLRLTSVLN